MPTDTTTRQLVLASASVGAGHNQAAIAVREAVRRAGGPEGEFVDALEHTPGWFRAFYAGGYNLTVTHFPRLYGLGYQLTSRLGTELNRDRARLLLERRVTRRFQRWLAERTPALVVATHYLPMAAVSHMRRTLGEGLRLWVVVTDYEAHRFWYADGVERYFVAVEDVARALAHWGVDPGVITVSGIPVHPKWTDSVDADEARRLWKIPAGRPVVIVSGGAYFTVGPVERIVRDLLAGSNAHVVALTGSNKKLLASMAALPEAGDRVTPVAFTDRLPELASLADVVVTKPGGLITSECMARGSAMVLTKPVPGQEAANARMLAAAGAAVVADSPSSVARAVNRLLAKGDARAALAAAARGLHKPAAATIAAEVLAALRG